MKYDDLSNFELEVLRRMLREAVSIWDAESSTLYGLFQMEIRAILKNWPSSIEADSRRAALAINNVSKDFIGGSNARSYTDEAFLNVFGVSRQEAETLYEKLKPRIDLAVDRRGV